MDVTACDRGQFLHENEDSSTENEDTATENATENEDHFLETVMFAATRLQGHQSAVWTRVRLAGDEPLAAP